MADKREPTELERVEKLFAFLQGNVPKDCVIPVEEVPNLTPDQAWTVIWYLGNQYWQVSDDIGRCGKCGELYDTAIEGTHLEEPPYHLCGNCDGDCYEDDDE